MKGKSTMYNIIIYNTDDGQADDGKVWLPLDQIAELFDKNKSTISRHTDGELDENSVVAKYATTASDGKTYDGIKNSDNKRVKLQQTLLLNLKVNNKNK